MARAEPTCTSAVPSVVKMPPPLGAMSKAIRLAGAIPLTPIDNSSPLLSKNLSSPRARSSGEELTRKIDVTIPSPSANWAKWRSEAAGRGLAETAGNVLDAEGPLERAGNGALPDQVIFLLGRGDQPSVLRGDFDRVLPGLAFQVSQVRGVAGSGPRGGHSHEQSSECVSHVPSFDARF